MTLKTEKCAGASGERGMRFSGAASESSRDENRSQTIVYCQSPATRHLPPVTVLHEAIELSLENFVDDGC